MNRHLRPLPSLAKATLAGLNEIPRHRKSPSAWWTILVTVVLWVPVDPGVVGVVLTVGIVVGRVVGIGVGVGVVRRPGRAGSVTFGRTSLAMFGRSIGRVGRVEGIVTVIGRVVGRVTGRMVGVLYPS